MEDNLAEIMIVLIILFLIALLLFLIFGASGSNHFSTIQNIIFMIKAEFVDSQLGT